MTAFETLLATSTVIEERHLLQTALEALQCEVDAPSATRAIERLSSSGLLVELGRHKDRPVYTTQSMIDLETGMIAAAVAARESGNSFSRNGSKPRLPRGLRCRPSRWTLSGTP